MINADTHTKKMLNHVLYSDGIIFFATRKCQKIQKINENS